jgi:hypothetical protein
MSISRIQNITLYIFFFFVNFQTLGVYGISLPKISAFIYLVSILPELGKFVLIKKVKPFIIPIWLFFLLLTLVSLFHIKGWEVSFFDFQLFQYIAIFWFMINHGYHRPLVMENGMLSLAFGSITVAVLYSSGIGIEIVDGRSLIFGENPNLIGLNMCITIIILCLAVLQNKLKLGKVRYLLLLPIPLMLQLMADTASRVAFIAFVLSFVVGVLFLQVKSRWLKLVVILIGTVVFVAILQYLLHSELLMARLIASYQIGDLSGRQQIYNRILSVVEQNLIFGIGKTGYFYLFGIGSPHNVFLEILVYTGVAGLILYLTFLFSLVRIAYKYMRRTGYILSLLLYIPVLGMLLSGQVLEKKIVWIIYAYTVSCSFEIKEKFKLTKAR